MPSKKILYSGIAALFLLILISAAVYELSETEQAVITQFGKPVGSAITEPGLHSKIPFIQTVNKFDKRFLEWDGNPNEIPTRDKRFIRVDTYARWRIADPLLFFQRVSDERSAFSRLDDILDGETRNAIAKHDLVELIRSHNRDSLTMETNDVESIEEPLAKIKTGRSEICRMIKDIAAPRTMELGIELLDIRFKRINYNKEVQNKINERMITERKRIADKFRSEGQGAASKILGDRERELKRIQSEAYRTAQELIGRADGEAARVYASAYNQSPDAAEFYRFIKTMETYKTSLGEKDWLLLSTQGDFFRYLNKK
ncbi:MAG TPA: protease modulator HflC [Spirochaetia bacterium]|nr:protease modulator HflC [Spirochaetia bacterium]